MGLKILYIVSIVATLPITEVEGHYPTSGRAAAGAAVGAFRVLSLFET
jgi:hypothetical protein